MDAAAATTERGRMTLLHPAHGRPRSGDGTVHVECYRPGCEKPLVLAIFDHAIRARDMKSDPYGKAWLFLEDCDEDE